MLNHSNSNLVNCLQSQSYQKSYTYTYRIHSLVPSLPFPNTNLRKQEKRRDRQIFSFLFKKPVKQEDWSRGYKIHTLLLTQGNTPSLIHISLRPTAVLTSWCYKTISTVKADEGALNTTLNGIGRSSETSLR